MTKEERITFETLKSSEENSIWLHEHYNELKVKYPDEFVACFRKKVIAHHKDIKKLREILERKYPDDVRHISYQFVTPEKVELVL